MLSVERILFGDVCLQNARAKFLRPTKITQKLVEMSTFALQIGEIKSLFGEAQLELILCHKALCTQAHADSVNAKLSLQTPLHPSVLAAGGHLPIPESPTLVRAKAKLSSLLEQIESSEADPISVSSDLLKVIRVADALEMIIHGRGWQLGPRMAGALRES